MTTDSERIIQRVTYCGLETLKLATGIACGLMTLSICSNAQIVPLTDGYPGSTLNQHLRTDALTWRYGPKAIKKPKVVVFIGDRVIAQFVDGAAWQTANGGEFREPSNVI